MLRVAPIGFAFALLMGAFSCGPPEVQACEDYVKALRACTDRNADASGPGEDSEPCDGVASACQEYFECAAAAACAEDAAEGFYTLDLSGCAEPEGVRCP